MGLGWEQDAAREAAELQLVIRQAEVRVDAMMTRLRDLFHAVEWWDSSDCSEDSVKEALEKYRLVSVE